MIKRLSKAVFFAVILAAPLSYTAAQAPQSSSEATAKELPREFPAPRNLKVLPKNLNGKQVQDIMEAWQAALGVKCEACHEWAKEKDKTIVASQLNFANDSKPMEGASRLMYIMTEEINSKFVAKVEGSGMPVTCGTCHRGRVAPEPFSPPPPRVNPYQYSQDGDNSVAKTNSAYEPKPQVP
jgi:hypothetical protein